MGWGCLKCIMVMLVVSNCKKSPCRRKIGINECKSVQHLHGKSIFRITMLANVEVSFDQKYEYVKI